MTKEQELRRTKLRKRVQRRRRVVRFWQYSVPRSQKRSINLIKARRILKQAEKEYTDFLAALSTRRSNRISDNGIALIAEFEGVYLKAYNDPVGYCTCGIGHLIRYSNCTSEDYKRWAGLTKAQAYELLKKDIRGYEEAVIRAVKVPLSQNELDACVSLCYNIGPGGFSSSTVVKMLNLRQRTLAANAFLLWVRGGGQTLPGLVRRRKAERALFLKKV